MDKRNGRSQLRHARFGLLLCGVWALTSTYADAVEPSEKMLHDSKPEAAEVAPVEPESVRRLPLPRLTSIQSYLNAHEVDARSVVFLYWISGALADSTATIRVDKPNRCSLDSLLSMITGLGRSQFNLAEDLLEVTVAGDWSVNRGAETPDILQSTQRVLSKAGLELTFTPSRQRRPVIRIAGQPEYSPIPIRPRGDGIYLFDGEPNSTISAVLTSRDGRALIDAFEDHLQVPVVHHEAFAKSVSSRTRVIVMESALPGQGGFETPTGLAKLNRILKNASVQSGLTIELESREVAVWTVKSGQ